MNKAELRREMRQRLRAVGAGRSAKSAAISAAVAAHPAFQPANDIALFSGLPSEPGLEPLWEHRAGGFCFPRIVEERIEFFRVDSPDELSPAAWNAAIREPQAAGSLVPPAAIELIIVPGLAFTRRGLRLGRGGGFYDRYLARLDGKCVKLGVCFDVQLLETLPVEPHDQRVDAVVTESGMMASV